MRVVELMKRRCRRVLEWAAAVTVTVFHCILQSTPPLLGCSSRQKNAATQKNEKRDLGMGHGRGD